ncbi:MAG: S-layer-like protein [bacterium]|nr:S-layer-like protein [bacterium]
MKRAIALVVVLVAQVAGAAPTTARPNGELLSEAKRRFQHANVLYQDGRYADALHLYQAAYDLVPSPDILFNIGLSKEKVFDYEGCSLTFRQYLTQSKDEGRTAQAKERLERCRAQTLIPVKVSSLPPSAAVSVGSGEARRPSGRTPARLDLRPGTYEITVESPGYVAQSQTVLVEEGLHPDIDFTLEKLSTLRIEADVAGAEIEIDDKHEGATPLSREVKAGLYRVLVHKPGFAPVKREVRVSAGDQVSLVISLTALTRERQLDLRVQPPVPAQVLLDGVAVGTAPVQRRVATGPHRLEVVSPGRVPYAGELSGGDDGDVRLRVHLTPRRTRTQRALFWTLESIASAGAATGLVFGVLNLRDQSSFNAQPSVALRDEAHRYAVTCDAAFIASAVVGIGAGIYYLVTWPRSSHAERLPDVGVNERAAARGW